MKYASLKEEKKLWKQGYKTVVCLDEAGRGPLAGPVVVTAVAIDQKVLKNKLLNNINLEKLKLVDSKKLSKNKRKELFKILTKHPGIKWEVTKVSERVIDKINILEATKLAMLRSITKFEKNNKKLKVNYLLVDGNMVLNTTVLQKSIVKGDEKVFSCAIASIIAKETRDNLMERYHIKHPEYRFDLHKGYATKLHLQRLKKYGPCKIHRKSFSPIKT